MTELRDVQQVVKQRLSFDEIMATVDSYIQDELARRYQQDNDALFGEVLNAVVMISETNEKEAVIVKRARAIVKACQKG